MLPRAFAESESHGVPMPGVLLLSPNHYIMLYSLKTCGMYKTDLRKDFKWRDDTLSLFLVLSFLLFF
jgi:hypothetical protein